MKHRAKLRKYNSLYELIGAHVKAFGSIAKEPELKSLRLIRALESAAENGAFQTIWVILFALEQK